MRTNNTNTPEIMAKIGDVCDVVPGYAFKSKDWQSSGIPVVKIKNIKEDGTIDLLDVDYVSEALLTSKLNKYILDDGSILIAMTGATAGKVGKLRTEKKVLLNQRVARIVPQSADYNYLWSVISSENYQRIFFKLADGAAQPNMSGNQIEGVEIPLPDINEQQRIGRILSAYDELIENCQKRIRILEEMARSLYREWFVNFRFPGHESARFIDSPLGRIPEGWVVRELGEIAEDVRRNVPKGELDEAVPYVGLEHIPRRSLALDAWEMTTELGSNKLQFKQGEVLFGKIRPYFHKVSVAPFDGLCSADTIVIRPKKPEHYAIVVACVSSDAFVAEASASANGAKMPRANWDILEKYKLIVPNGTIAEQFSNMFTSLIKQQQSLVFLMHNLRQTREVLLQRLLS